MEVSTDPDMFKSVFWRKDGQKISKLRYNYLIDQWVSQSVAKCSCENDMHKCPAQWGKGNTKGGPGGGWNNDWNKSDWDMDDWNEGGPSHKNWGNAEERGLGDNRSGGGNEGRGR